MEIPTVAPQPRSSETPHRSNLSALIQNRHLPHRCINTIDVKHDSDPCLESGWSECIKHQGFVADRLDRQLSNTDPIDGLQGGWNEQNNLFELGPVAVEGH